MNTNRQIEANLEERPTKAHELELLGLIRNEHPRFAGRVLDIGCASGAFIRLMAASFPLARYVGFDISETLIERALNQRNLSVRCEFLVADALSFEADETFDIVVASGVLSIFDDFTEPLDKWLSWLGEKGTLYIFGRFNSKDIDTIIKFRNNVCGKGEWEGGMTAYSINTVSRYLLRKGYESRFDRFHLPLKLQEDPNPVRTYTKDMQDGETLVVNGANIIAEHYFCRIRKIGAQAVENCRTASIDLAAG